jgi:hypothetical protein
MKTMSNAWSYICIPEDAARGIIIIDTVPDINPDTGNSKTYVDVENNGKNLLFQKTMVN